MKIQLGLLLVVVLFVSLPSVVFSQPPLGAVQPGETSQIAPKVETAEAEVAKARQDAERDAELSVGQGSWFAFGFFCGGFGVIFATLSSSNADPLRLAGKSPSYVNAYVTTYKSRTKKRKVNSSVAGCLTQSALTTLAILSAR